MQYCSCFPIIPFYFCSNCSQQPNKRGETGVLPFSSFSFSILPFFKQRIHTGGCCSHLSLSIILFLFSSLLFLLMSFNVPSVFYFFSRPSLLFLPFIFSLVFSSKPTLSILFPSYAWSSPSFIISPPPLECKSLHPRIDGFLENWRHFVAL